MKLAVSLITALALAPAAAASVPFRATLVGGTHYPPANDVTKWRYTITVRSNAGKPIAARITIQIADPFGGVHPVDFDCCVNKHIVNHRIVGRFHDAVEWPPDSKGFRLTFRVTVKALGKTRVLTTWVKPH